MSPLPDNETPAQKAEREGAGAYWDDKPVSACPLQYQAKRGWYTTRDEVEAENNTKD